jgi:hypothetical protein
MSIFEREAPTMAPGHNPEVAPLESYRFSGIAFSNTSTGPWKRILDEAITKVGGDATMIEDIRSSQSLQNELERETSSWERELATLNTADEAEKKEAEFSGDLSVFLKKLSEQK